MEFFLDTVETINRSECDGFDHFDTGHTIWLVLFLCACLVCTVIYRKMDVRSRRIMRYVFAFLMIADEILKYVIIGIDGVSAIGYLPLQLCSISIILTILHALLTAPTREVPEGGELDGEAPGGSQLAGGEVPTARDIFDRYAGNFLYVVGLPAGLSAILFPSWTALPAFANLMSIHSFSVHIIFVTYIIMLISAKEIRPELRTAPVVVCALIAMAICVYLFDVSFGVNYMYLVHISPASPLAPFEALGDYRIGYAVILAALLLVMYGIPQLLRKR